jgi:hypothetical protein
MGSSKSPSPAPGDVPNEPSRHGRKSSISRSIAGAFGFGAGVETLKRGKSPGPGGRKSMDWSAEPPANRMPSSTSTLTIKTLAEKPPDKGQVPPPIAAKPGWLRRTASGNKMLAGLGLGSLASSSGSMASNYSLSTAGTYRDLTGVAEGEDEPVEPRVMGPPSLPPRKEKPRDTPVLPPRKSGHAPNGSTSRLSIASALDFRRPKSPGRMPSATLQVPEPTPQVREPPTFSMSLDESTLLESAGNVADGNGLLPPPPQRAAHSMDVPRKLPNRHQAGSSALGSISGLPTQRLRTPRGNVGAESPRPESIAFPSSNSSSFLQAAPGVLGSAVSTGWAALRSTRSSLSFPHSSSGTFPRSGSTADSSWIRVDGDAPSRTGLGYEGPTLAPEAVKRPAGQEDGLVFGKDLEQAARSCPIVTTETDTVGKRKQRYQCLPAVAIRCVDHRE